MEKRIGYIDIAKGLGIMIIVLAHNDLAGYHPTLHKFIYSFHIPLFFFLSGMFFRPERSFGETFTRRFNSLMKPYFLKKRDSPSSPPVHLCQGLKTR